MPTLPKLLALCVVTASAACSVDAVTFRMPPVAIGGTIAGLDGSGLVLTNNGGDELEVARNGAFAFMSPLDRGASYALAVKRQPSSPAQRCSIANGTGTAGDADVTDVQVSCETSAFRIGGTVTGLAGAGLVLLNNAGDPIPVNADGTFVFATLVPSGATYDVRVTMQPSQPTQECTVTAGAGTVGDADVTNIDVACVTRTFTISGTVTGLRGAGLVLQNNGADDLPLGADGGFTFATPIASGATFAVSVRTQPAMPSQTCTVAGGTGTVGAGNVTSVAINCTTNSYMIGGTISGLVNSVRLRNNGGDELTVTANGTFAFSTPVLSGGSYDVIVQLQPFNPWQTCAVAAGAGTVTNANVTSVAVTCTTNRYKISGSSMTLATGNTVTLRNNGGDDTTMTGASGSFTFPTLVESGQSYNVTLVASPTSPVSQTCSLISNAGIVTNDHILGIKLLCTTNEFTIGGTVTGLTGTGLVLQHNFGGQVAIAANGAFTIPQSLPSTTPYNVTVKTQPSGQTCTVANGTGTVASSNITNVQITCGSLSWPTTLFPIAIPGSDYGAGDLDLDNNGDLLVTVTSPTRALVRVNRSTGARTTIATGIGTGFLLGVAYRAANNMIYTHTDTGQIFAVTPAGAVTPLVAVGGGLNAIAIAPASFGGFGGFIIGVTQAGSVVAVNPANGAVTTITASTSAASDLAFAPSGTLFISGSTSVRTVTAAGAVSSFASGFGSADGITLSPDGARMFIADSGTGTVKQLTVPGGVVSTIGGAAINGGYFVGGILAAPGNTLIVMTGGSLTLVAFPY